jgi:hypothetical protein
MWCVDLDSDDLIWVDVESLPTWVLREVVRGRATYVARGDDQFFTRGS